MGARSPKFDFDFIVIGSGFGGSVSALRLVEKGYRVAVIEMGRRWAPLSFPRTSWSIHRWFWRPQLGLRGFFNMRFFRHATIFHGCAVGGGSITYAGTLLPPPDKVWQNGSWAGLADLESGDATPLSGSVAHARRHAKSNSRTCRPPPAKNKRDSRLRPDVLSHAYWHLPGCGRRTGQHDFL